MNDLLNIYAPGNLDPADSYGLIACRLCQYIEAAGKRAQPLVMGERCVDGQSAVVAEVASRPLKASLGGIVLGYPTGYYRYGALASSGPRVAITMFESTNLPAGWVYELNRCAAVVTPSQFCADVFTEKGVSVPVHVIPLGIGDSFRPVRRSLNGVFSFVAFADRGRRKGAHIAAMAFMQAFGESRKHRLVLKSRSVEKPADIVNANIDLVQEDMSEDELARLYQSMDCMVFPSMGEGFGLPPREFAATGGPVIATAWGGMADVGDWGLPLDYKMTEAWEGHDVFDEDEYPGMWASPDIDQLAILMQEVASEADIYHEWAYHNAREVIERYQWKHFADGVLAVWNDVVVRHYGNRNAA